jgi:hypothetical protein
MECVLAFGFIVHRCLLVFDEPNSSRMGCSVNIGWTTGFEMVIR